MRFSRTISLILALVLAFFVVTPAASESYTENTAWIGISAEDWGSGTSLLSGNYILTEDLTLSNALIIPAGELVCIDLAGFSILANDAEAMTIEENTTAPCAIENHGALTIFDSTAAIADETSIAMGTISGIAVCGAMDAPSYFNMFGGKLASLQDNSIYNTIAIYSGETEFDPSTAGEDGGSVIGECACMKYDALIDAYTVTHVSAETCAHCAADSPSESFAYVLIGDHIYNSGYVCTNCELVTATIESTAYTELDDALAAADANSIVVLQRDVRVDALDLYTTLDLNGKHCIAAGVIDAANADAHIVDNVGGGTVTASSIKMYQDNGQLAIDAENNNVYSYETVALKQKVTVVDTDSASVKFYIDKVSESTKLDDSILAGANVKVRLTVEWYEGDIMMSHSFVYKQELVDAYVGGWDSKMFTCTIAGLEELGEYTITADVVSCDVVVKATEVRRLLTWKEYLALSGAEQKAYKESFENRSDYYVWLKEARDAYDAEQETEMDGDINIGDILNP